MTPPQSVQATSKAISRRTPLTGDCFEDGAKSNGIASHARLDGRPTRVQSLRRTGRPSFKAVPIGTVLVTSDRRTQDCLQIQALSAPDNLVGGVAMPLAITDAEYGWLRPPRKGVRYGRIL